MNRIKNVNSLLFRSFILNLKSIAYKLLQMESKKGKYIEISDISNFILKNQIVTNRIDINLIDNNLIPIELKLKEINIIVYVMDEYDDLNYKNELLDTVLVLRELELLEESRDFINWCKDQGVTVNNDKLRNYYIEIVHLIPKIKEHFPNKEITSFFSDLDFQLNSGAISLLRKY